MTVKEARTAEGITARLGRVSSTTDALIVLELFTPTLAGDEATLNVGLSFPDAERLAKSVPELIAAHRADQN